jgi:hypothetical protein
MRPLVKTAVAQMSNKADLVLEPDSKDKDNDEEQKEGRFREIKA